jgi:hypothetical protein
MQEALSVAFFLTEILDDFRGISPMYCPATLLKMRWCCEKQSCVNTIPGLRLIEKYDMARTLTVEIKAQLKHCFGDIRKFTPIISADGEDSKANSCSVTRGAMRIAD